MQPSWITVPWLQFQSVGGAPPGLTPQGQMLASPPPTAAHPQPHYPTVNGLTPLSSACITTSHQPSVFTSVAGLTAAHVTMAAGLNHSPGMLNGGPLPNTLSTINGYKHPNSLNTMNGAGLPNTISTINGGTLSNTINGLSLPQCIPTLQTNGVTSLGLAGLGSLGNPMGTLGTMMALAPPNTGPLGPSPLMPLRPRQAGPLTATLLPVKEQDLSLSFKPLKRKAEEEFSDSQDIKKAKLETKALKAKRPGFSEERYNETSYFIENGLRKVYPYYFTFTTFTKGRWVGEKILDVFAKEFRAHPAEEYERCIKSGTLTVNYERVDTDCRLKHNDLLANIVHRHETPVLARRIEVMHLDEELVVLDKPCSLPVHPCGRYRHNTVVFILAKEYNLKNLRTIHRLDRLTSGLLLFGRTPKKAREMEQQIRTRQVSKQYVCRVEGRFPSGVVVCSEPIEVVSYKIGVCKVSPKGKDCKTEFQLLSYNGSSSVVLCKPRTGRMHQIRVHLQYLGYPIVNDPLYNHTVFGPNKGKGGITEKTDEQLIQDLIKIHNAENWLGMDGDVEYSMFKGRTSKEGEEEDGEILRSTPSPKDKMRSASNTPSSAAEGSATSNELTDTLKVDEQPPPQTRSPSSEGVTCSSTPSPTDSHHHSNNNNHHHHLFLNSSSSNTIKGGGDYVFRPHLNTVDKNCYECKVRYRDPKPKDLVMFLHALKYSGPGWQFETKMPDWAAPDWRDEEES